MRGAGMDRPDLFITLTVYSRNCKENHTTRDNMLIHLSFNNVASPRKWIKIHHFRPESNEKEKILIIV